MEIRTSKTGKHGHAKATFTIIGLFSNKKTQESFPTHANVYSGDFAQAAYTLIDLEKNGMYMYHIYCILIAMHVSLIYIYNEI